MAIQFGALVLVVVLGPMKEMSTVAKKRVLEEEQHEGTETAIMAYCIPSTFPKIFGTL